MSVAPAVMLDMYIKMVTVRQAELRIARLFNEGRLPGFVHLYVGQEAVGVGVLSQLRAEDYVVSTHRCHGHIIARGGNLKRIFAEIYGKVTGYCKGKGGSMHLADLETGFLGGNGIVGAGLPIAVGAAFGAKYRATDYVVACFFGDGTSNQGTFHEALNLAGLWKLPVVFICENNLYAEGTSQDRHQSIENIADRGAAYGIPGVVVDGNDVMAVYEAMAEAVRLARAGGGATLLECKTYRHRGHFEGDPELYRSSAEVAGWVDRDPIPRFESYLLENKLLSQERIAELDRQVQQQVDEAVMFAEQSPYPAIEELVADVYSP